MGTPTRRCRLSLARMGLLLGMVLLLGACASHTRSTVESLNREEPAFQQPMCQHAMTLADLHDSITIGRTVGSPLLLVAGGTPALLPVLLVNMSHDALDRSDASHVSEACGGLETPLYNRMERVMLGGLTQWFGRWIKPGQ